MHRVGQELARTLSSLLMAVALTALVVPPTILQAVPCCGGSVELAGGEGRTVSEEDLKKFRAEWERLTTAAQLSLDELDRSRFELRPLQDKLGTDPDAIFKWVRENTRWVPYQGALKGPRGVLLARQGNTLDRALFLARLMELAGHSVRIANGDASPRRLPDLEKAARASMVAELPDLAPAKKADPKRFAEVAATLDMTVEALQAETATVHEKRTEFTKRLSETTDRHVVALRELLKGEDLPLAQENKEPLDRVKASLRQHYWVQLMTEGNKWKDYDLFFESGKLPGLVVIFGAPFEGSKIPAKLLHAATLKVVVVAVDGTGHRTERVALEYTMTPAHFGAGEFALSFVDLRAPPPAQLFDQLAGKDNAALFASLEKRSEWVPVIAFAHGGEPFAQSGFNAEGDLIPDPLAVGQTVGSRVKAGVSLLETLGREAEPTADKTQLAEVRFEVATKAGTGVGSVEQRVVYRRANDGEQSEARRRAVALGRTTQFLVQTGRIPGELAQEVQCESLLSVNLAMRYLLGEAEAGDREEVRKRAAKVMEKTYTFSPVLHALAAERQAAERTRHFHSGPNVLSLMREWSVESDTLKRREVVDFLANAIETIPGGGEPGGEFWANLRGGVSDSVLESEAHLARRAGLSTSRAFFEDAASWQLIKSADDPRLASWKAPPGEAREAIHADLERGHWVVVDLGASNEDGVAWWRVNPRTGAALGVVAEGDTVGGAAMPEWLIITLRVVIAAGMHFYNLYKCLFDGPSSGAGTAVCVGCVFVASYIAVASLGGAFGSSSAGLGTDAIGLVCTALAEVL